MDKPFAGATEKKTTTTTTAATTKTKQKNKKNKKNVKKRVHYCLKASYTSPDKCQPHKMAKHTQTIRWLLPANCLSMFHQFVGLALKGLSSVRITSSV